MSCPRLPIILGDSPPLAGAKVVLFNSFAFAGFFCLVFAVYWAIPRHRGRMLWLLAASCAFYMSWKPLLILLILFSASIDFLAARWLERLSNRSVRRCLLLLSIGCNVGLLAFFKYTNFLLDNGCTLLNWAGLAAGHPLLRFLEDWGLPLGISFYTFETISYVVDVYRGRVRAQRSLLDYALYIMFFPHLIAGPIVRPRDFLPQLRRAKRFDWDRTQLGAQLFVIGLIKKAVLADWLAAAADPVFAAPAEYGSGALWLAVLCYSGQIFCDFSGYSDMAIGVAHTFGFKLPMNFNMPYLASNISDFWRRWHISLSSWLRDYIYIPLGGNRCGTARTYVNLMLTMLLGGLWHGANWTFVFWGFYHGALLAVHRAVRLPRWLGSALFRPLAVAGTFLLVSVGWVFFRAPTFGNALCMLRGMFAPLGGLAIDRTTQAIAVACLLAILVGHLIGQFVPLGRLERRLPAPVLGTLLAALLIAAQVLVPESGKAFLYFQF